MPKHSRIENLTASEFVAFRLRRLDDLFLIEGEKTRPDYRLMVRVLDEARRLENLINKSSVNGCDRTMKIEFKDAPNEAIKKKADFIESLRKTSGNEREAFKRARLDKITALNFAANDAAFRKAWETASNQKLF